MSCRAKRALSSFSQQLKTGEVFVLSMRFRACIIFSDATKNAKRHFFFQFD
jgi:hypothetical protein